MEFKELIKMRRSIRHYDEKPVDNEVIKEIIEDALLAPTWKNSETGRYYVANTPEMVAKVNEALPEFNQKNCKNAALVVTTFVQNISGFMNGVADNEFGNKWGAYDLGLQNAYFVLSASEHGLDTLIMGIRDADALRKTLDIPEDEQIASVIALGYRTEDGKLYKRKSVEEVIKYF